MENPTWSSAEKAWLELLNEIQAVRADLRCSISKSWFRGHSNSDEYNLIPSLFRGGRDVDLNHKHLYKESRRNRSYAKYKIKALNEKRRKLLSVSTNRIMSDETSSELHSLADEIKVEKSKLGEINKEVRRNKLLWQGEAQAFIDYGFQSATGFNAWQTLADMQHHGVPTRMLDWTENMLVALYFSLSQYRSALNKLWQEDGSLTSQSQVASLGKNSFYLPSGIPTPSVWVLSPYKASYSATKRLRIWDVSSTTYLDYNHAFINEKSWPFDGAIPAYSPWREARIAAQQGMFMVFGYDERPLDDQLNRKILREIKIPPAAAVYGVWFLQHIAGISHYSMFRDRDSLARKVTQEFIK